MNSAFLRRVKIRNYKSLGACDVALGPLALLVGPNGSGKSNFLEALRLIPDALNTTMDHALRDRGGIADVRRRSPGHPFDFSVEVDFAIPGGPDGRYGFEVAAVKGGFEIKRERLQVRRVLEPWDSFDVQRGEVAECSVAHPPRAASDRLYLVAMSGHEGFRPVYDAFTSMGFYNLDPVQIRELQPPDMGRTLARDGRNIASVISRLKDEDPQGLERVREYLERVVPGIRSVERVQVASRETLEFRQVVKGAKDPWRFQAISMSDGTLRALGILVALFQRGVGDVERTPFVGIEEPEAALHPAAAGVLLAALRDASARTQVLATTHSPQLLDDDDILDSELVAVRSQDGATTLGPVDAAGRQAMADRLYTAGELLAQDQLRPEPERASAAGSQLLFQALRDE